MLRWTIAGVIVIGLLAGIWLLWPRDEEGVSPTTVPLAAETTTTSEGTTTTELTTTTVDPTQVREVETVKQAEAILRELWFGWFEGIYNQDEDRIREVVATEDQYQQGIRLFDSMEFTRAPTAEAIDIQSLEILRTDSECLAVWVRADSSAFRGEDSTGEAVYVLRWTDQWGLASSWLYREDLWEQDCESQLS